MFKPKSKVPTALEIIDIAGLVAGAHKGEGLGNNFLSNIQAVDGIFHMVRAFKGLDITHVEGEVNPVNDMDVISNELIQKDIMNLTTKINDLSKKVERFNDSSSKKQLEFCKKALQVLEKGTWIKDAEFTNKEIFYLNDLLFFTAKPVVYLVNISTKNFASKKNKWLLKIKAWIEEKCPGKLLPFSVTYE